MPRFSIITPVYNSAEYLPVCVDSIRNQTFSDWELILVDDASTDGSRELCDQIADEDDRISVVHHSRNFGAGHARNTGLLKASGEYLLFLDGDDYWDVNYLLSLEACIGSDQLDMYVNHEYNLAYPDRIVRRQMFDPSVPAGNFSAGLLPDGTNWLSGY